MLKFCKHSFSLLKQNFSTGDNTLLVQCLKERTILRISGTDASVYLQGLITNDMKHLQDGASSMFTMFLNSKGRILYDSLIYNTNNESTFFIECDEDGADSLRDHLLRYKVRRKISIDCLKDELDLWTVNNNKTLQNTEDVPDYKTLLNVMKQNFPDLVVTCDPRLPSLGLRIIAPKNLSLVEEIKNKTDVEAQQDNFYKLLRYKLGIGEGMQELTAEKCFPMEVNGDYLHGISFHKGCYIGQELTARTYHTGTIRKRLMPLIFTEEPKKTESGTLIFSSTNSNKSIGKLQGVEKTNGVGLLRIEEALKADELVLLDLKCTTHRPFWWPNEAPKERMKIG